VGAPTAPFRLLLEGRPGSGKTTAAARLVELARAAGVSVSGFLTRELREGGQRVGFALETVDGHRGVLAHVGIRGAVRVGRYGVVLDDLERLAIPALSAEADLVVADELGKMELASGPFRNAVTALYDRPVAVVATVHTHPHPFTDDLKRRPSVTVLQLTRANRDDLPTQIASSLLSRRHANASR
jgi:nucleoside-triphosphatase